MSNPGSREAQDAMKRVKARWPDAFIQDDLKVFWGTRCYAVWNFSSTGPDVPERVIGRGDTPDETWLSAANHPTVVEHWKERE